MSIKCLKFKVFLYVLITVEKRIFVVRKLTSEVLKDIQVQSTYEHGYIRPNKWCIISSLEKLFFIKNLCVLCMPLLSKYIYKIILLTLRLLNDVDPGIIINIKAFSVASLWKYIQNIELPNLSVSKLVWALDRKWSGVWLKKLSRFSDKYLTW